MSDFPNSIFEPRELENLAGIEYDPDDLKTIFAEDLNNASAEIVAIEETLGTNPEGAYDSVKAWLTALASDVAKFFSTSIIDPGHKHSKLTSSDGSPDPVVQVDAAGNVGVGLTPLGWGGAFVGKVLDLFGLSLVSTSRTDGRIFQNVYFNGSAYVTAVTGESAIIQMGGGEILIYTASSVSAGSAPTFGARFFIKNNGNVGIGTTTPGSKLAVVGLPTSVSGLSAGDIWVDTTGGLNVLKIV